MTRFPDLDEERLSPEQQLVFDGIARGSRGTVRGPFRLLLHNPELARRVEQLGIYARYECSVPQRLRELAIVCVAYHWRADYEWYIHAPIARAQGVPADVLNAIGRGDRPEFQEAADASVHAFTTELLTSGRVSDPVFERCREELGNTGVLDLTGLIGYYTLLALVINAGEVPAAETREIPWRQSRS